MGETDMNDDLILHKAVLHTRSLMEEIIKAKPSELKDADAINLEKIYSMLDGQSAIVMPSFYEAGEYILLGLWDREQDKEFHYLMEQDTEAGCYIDNRKEFERDYNSGEYSKDFSFCLDSEYVEIISCGLDRYE